MSTVAPYTVNEDGISSITLTEPSGSGLDQPVTAKAWIDCSILNQTDAYLRQAGGGRLAGPVRATLDAYAFLWAKAARAALAGAAVFAVVYAAVVAAMVALGAATGPGATIVAPGVAAVAGCLAGWISGAVIHAVYTGRPLSGNTMLSAVVGCVAGATTGVVTTVAIRWWIASAIGAAVDIPAPVENAAVTAAQAQQVEMATMGSSSTALTTAAEAEATDTQLNNFLSGLEPH
jgi:hypothetical protein